MRMDRRACSADDPVRQDSASPKHEAGLLCAGCGQPLACLRNLKKHGLVNGGTYFASRDLEAGDRTVGISTDAGDIEVRAVFLSPGHEYDNLADLPIWMTAFCFGYSATVHGAQGSQFDRVLLIDEWPGRDRIAWLYTGITRAVKSITIARRL